MIKPKETTVELDIDIEPVKKSYNDIMVGIKKTKGAIKNKITIQKVTPSTDLPLPSTGTTMNFGIFSTQKPRRKKKTVPLSKNKKNDIRRPKKR